MLNNENFKNTPSSLYSKIVWKGFYSHALFLTKKNKEDNKKQSKKKNNEKISKMLNFFLLSPDLLSKDNLLIYYDSLSLLSYLYFITENLYGLDWIYHLLKRLQLDKHEIPVELQVRVIVRYAYVLNKTNKCLEYLNQLIHEIEVTEGSIDSKLFNDWDNLKKEIEIKINNETTVKDIEPYFAWKTVYEDNDCWNVYIYDNKEEENQVQMIIQNIDKTSNNTNQETTSLTNEQFDKTVQDNSVNNENTNQSLITNIEPPLSINKLKVLALSNEIISHKIPILPRYIYWNDPCELNYIIVKLMGTNPFEYFKYEENSTNEELFFIISSFIINKQIIATEKTRMDDFLSDKDRHKYILIIASINDDQSNDEQRIIPAEVQNELIPFTDSSQTLLELKTENDIYNGRPAKNFGNTCYFNAGLQCILHCNLLSAYFKDKKYYEHYINKEYYETKGYDKDLVTPFYNLITSFNKDNLYNFLMTFLNIEEKYEFKKQHDSPELVTDILNNLGMQVCRAPYEYHEVPKQDKQNKFTELEQLLKKESSIITDLFYGQVKHRFICDKCEEENVIYESFIFLDLPIPSLSIEMVLFKNENANQQNVSVYYHQRQDLTANYIKLHIKKQENINVDVLVINYKKSEVKILEDNNYLFDLGLFSDLFNRNKYIEIVLYQKNNETDKPYYLIPCSKFKDKKPYKYENISTYPIQVCINNSNASNINDICTKFKNALQNGNIYLDNHSENKYIFFNGTNIIDVNNESISKFVNNPNQNYILYFQTTTTTPQDTLPQKEQIKSKDATLDECLSLFYNNTSTIKCKKCNNNKKINSTLTRLPQYLIVYFKRFYLDIETRVFKKNERVITFPPTLNLYDEDGKLFSYKAIALNIHKGNVKRGHYYAHCREGDRWFRFDDLKEKIEVEFQVNPGVLLTFYEKTN